MEYWSLNIKLNLLQLEKRADKITVIKPVNGWQALDLREVLRYRDLMYFLVIRGIKARYAQSVLGVSWAIIQPLFTTLIFTIIFGNLAKVDSDGLPYALFSFVALWPWTYFSNTLSESSNSLLANANMITKVYFPRLVLPLSAAFTKLLDFAIGFVVLLFFMLYFGIWPGWEVIFVPVLILVLLFTSLGIGMILSAMAVQYRDVKHALGFGIKLLLYLAPVIYSTNAVPVDYQFWYSLNPMVGVIEGFRAAFTGQTMPWHWILPGIPMAVILFVAGLFYFKRMERHFADVA